MLHIQPTTIMSIFQSHEYTVLLHGPTINRGRRQSSDLEIGGLARKLLSLIFGVKISKVIFFFFLTLQAQCLKQNYEHLKVRKLLRHKTVSP